MEKKPRSLHEALSGKLADDELEMVPRSFDVIGDIAIIELPDGIDKTLVGSALLETFKHIKTVAVKKTEVGTQYRTREVEVVAGAGRTETMHTEHGCRYLLDVSKAYFSPRLGTERMRVADKVQDGERVLVMFAGVGPYAILIAKKKKPAEVVAVELNPDAVDYMKTNIKLNKVKVTAVLGDAGEEAKNHGMFDRIVMPLPKDAGDFLDAAIPALNKNGTIHFYTFEKDCKEAETKVKEICEGLCCKIHVDKCVVCGSYSPAVSRICVDFRIEPRYS